MDDPMDDMGMLTLVAGTMGAAFCIWLAVRICNRRESWAILWAEGLGAILVLVVLGSQAAPELRGSWWSAVCALEFSPDGKILAAGLFDGQAFNEDFHYRNRDLSQSVALFDAMTGTHRTELSQTRGPGLYGGSSPLGTFLAFSPEGNTLAIGSYDGLVQLWNDPLDANVAITNDFTHGGCLYEGRQKASHSGPYLRDRLGRRQLCPGKAD